VKLLADTHTLLWSLIEPQRLSPRVRQALRSPENECAVSVVSFWEVSLKHGLGKLDLAGVTPDELPSAARRAGFELADVPAEVAASVHRLPRLGHKDPFDRLLVWQAICAGLTLVSKDRSLGVYAEHGLKLMW
jgi:PIN domain nuclease of toxin-antitoxin system